MIHPEPQTKTFHKTDDPSQLPAYNIGRSIKASTNFGLLLNFLPAFNMSKDSIVPEELFAEDDGVVTETSVKQQATERDVARFYKHYKAMDESQKWKLRKHHVVDSKVSLFFLSRQDTSYAYINAF